MSGCESVSGRRASRRRGVARPRKAGTRGLAVGILNPWPPSREGTGRVEGPTRGGALPRPAPGPCETVQPGPVPRSVPMGEATHILHAIAGGGPSAASQLLPLVYDELRKLAAHRLAQQAPGQTLQPTALVHEAYLRLVGDPGGGDWDNRGHFFAAAAEAMRRIPAEGARRKGRRKRGGGLARADLDAAGQVAVPEVREDLLALDEALTRLAAVNPQAAQLVQLRYFAGLP